MKTKNPIAFILSIICLSMFTTFMIIPAADKLTQKEMMINLEYASEEKENNIEQVYVKDLMVNSMPVQFTQTSGMEYDEEHGSYLWDGSSTEANAKLVIKSDDAVCFKIGYYLKSEEETVKAAKATVSMIGEGKEKSETYLLSQFGDRRQKVTFNTLRMNRVFRNTLLGLVFAVIFGIFGYLLKEEKAKKHKAIWLVYRVFYRTEWYLILWSIFCRKIGTLWFGKYIAIEGSDTFSYCMDKITDLSFCHRMPGYQLFIYGIQKLFGCAGYEEAFPYVADMQLLLGTLSVVVLYAVLKRLVKSNMVAVILSFLYASIPGVIVWEKCILTESIAIDMTIVFVYLLLRYLQQPSKKVAFGIGLFSLLMVLTRPSFVLFPLILLAAFALQFFLEKKNRCYSIWGLCGILVCILLLGGYCANNKRITGAYMLTYIAYINQVSILIDEDMFQNDSYPEITESIYEFRKQNTDSLSNAMNVFQTVDAREGIRYLNQTRMKYAKQYAENICITLKNVAGEKIWGIQDYELNESIGKWVTIWHSVCFPFSFLLAWILAGIELILAIRKSFKEKAASWMSLGIPILIFAISFTSIISLTHAAIQRLCVCLIPLVVFMIGDLIRMMIEWIISAKNG